MSTTCAIIRYDRARAAPPTAPLQRVEYSAAAGSYTAPPVARARAPTDCGVWPGRPGTQSLEAHAGTQRPHRSRYRQPRSCDSQEFLSSKSRVSCPPRPASLAVPLLQWCARARAACPRNTVNVIRPEKEPHKWRRRSRWRATPLHSRLTAHPILLAANSQQTDLAAAAPFPSSAALSRC